MKSLIVKQVRKEGVSKIVGIPKDCEIESGDFVQIKKMEMNVLELEDLD